MKRILIQFAVWTIPLFYLGTVKAQEKIDVSKVITKADAEAFLGVPVGEAKGGNKQSPDGFYDPNGVIMGQRR